MTTLNEKVVEIIESNDFNDLPIEERRRIIKYLGIMQILTLWQVLNQYGDVVTPAWRKKTRSWLEACVKNYQGKYSEVDMATWLKQNSGKTPGRMKEYICKEVHTENGGHLEIEKELILCENCYFCGTFQRKNWCTKYEHSAKQDGFCAWAETKEPNERT